MESVFFTTDKFVRGDFFLRRKGLMKRESLFKGDL